MSHVVILTVTVVLASLITRTFLDRWKSDINDIELGSFEASHAVRSIEAKLSLDEALRMAESAIVDANGTNITVDRQALAVTGWTGIHIGALGQQVTIVASQVDSEHYRLSAYCRPRCKTALIDWGRSRRRCDLVVALLERSGGHLLGQAI